MQTKKLELIKTAGVASLTRGESFATESVFKAIRSSTVKMKETRI